MPRRALQPNADYALTVDGDLQFADGRRLGRSLTFAVHTSGYENAAPVLTLRAPLDGADQVPANLRAILGATTRALSSLDFVLSDDDGGAMALVGAADPACDGCFTIALPEPLAEGRHYQLAAAEGVVGPDGQAPFGQPPGFGTGPARLGALTIDGLLVDASDGCVVARFGTAVATWARLCVDAACADDGPLISHELAVVSAAPSEIDLTAVDETTRPAAMVSVDPPPVSELSLRITEVLSNPLGARLSRQFVELQNLGSTPVALGGLLLGDDNGASPLPDALLGAGQVGVIVPSGFASAAGEDPDPAPGSLVVVLPVGHLGGNGLRVAGESVWLATPDGAMISRMTATPRTHKGQSRMRVGACDVAASVVATPSGTSTPGVVP
jgi:hypothetical protein